MQPAQNREIMWGSELLPCVNDLGSLKPESDSGYSDLVPTGKSADSKKEAPPEENPDKVDEDPEQPESDVYQLQPIPIPLDYKTCYSQQWKPKQTVDNELICEPIVNHLDNNFLPFFSNHIYCNDRSSFQIAHGLSNVLADDLKTGDYLFTIYAKIQEEAQETANQESQTLLDLARRTNASNDTNLELLRRFLKEIYACGRTWQKFQDQKINQLELAQRAFQEVERETFSESQDADDVDRQAQLAKKQNDVFLDLQNANKEYRWYTTIKYWMEEVKVPSAAQEILKQYLKENPRDLRAGRFGNFRFGVCPLPVIESTDF